MKQNIFKEEADTLKDNNLEMRDVGKDIANVSRKFYINKLNENI